MSFTPNLSTAVMLLDKGIRAVNKIYKPDTDGNKQPRTMFKTYDKDVKPGDLVVVPSSTRHEFTVVIVSEVDVEVDFSSSTKVAWIAAKIDLQAFDAIMAREAKMFAVIKESEDRKKQAELLANIKEMVGDSYQQLTALSGPPAIEATTTGDAGKLAE